MTGSNHKKYMQSRFSMLFNGLDLLGTVQRNKLKAFATQFKKRSAFIVVVFFFSNWSSTYIKIKISNDIRETGIMDYRIQEKKKKTTVYW